MLLGYCNLVDFKNSRLVRFICEYDIDTDNSNFKVVFGGKAGFMQKTSYKSHAYIRITSITRQYKAKKKVPAYLFKRITYKNRDSVSYYIDIGRSGKEKAIRKFIIRAIMDKFKVKETDIMFDNDETDIMFDNDYTSE